MGTEETMTKPAVVSTIAADVRKGLSQVPKSLPPYLFYDRAGSALYEQITKLPEYYLTRTERAIVAEHADAIIEQSEIGSSRGRIIELGAGSATKTELLLEAAMRKNGRCVYVPIDVSESALDEARLRLATTLPDVVVRPYAMSHAEALRLLRGHGGGDLVLFIGSSIGNFDDPEAVRLLAGVHDALGPRTSLLLGTDLKKSADVLVRAYDDRAGTTAAFNKNILVHINRELGAHFDPDRFRHVARWNDGASRIEMHLESIGEQSVAIDALGMTVAFEAGETIHTESSVKYDRAHVERLLEASGFQLRQTFYDDERRFGVHLARG
jgi:L-histidine Nalpha-methyltransferase